MLAAEVPMERESNTTGAVPILWTKLFSLTDQL